MSAQRDTESSNDRPAKRVLLIGWDAADWKMVQPLIDRGHMPNLKRFVDEGVTGNIASLQPMLSPILWTSIATGKHADKHQILGFAEPDGSTGKVRPVTSTSRRCRALWNILSERGLRSGVVNWFASHPAEEINGFIVTDRYPHAVGPPDKDWPGVERSVHPAELLERACELRVHPASTTPQQVLPFMPKVAEDGGVDPAKDEHLHELRVELARCATVHSVSTWLMQEQTWDLMAIYYDAIDRFGHSFMEFHPPRMEHVSEADFERYKEVMTGCYRFHDMMLGRLMELAGPETTIIITSDHGFHSDHLRPTGTSAIKDGQPVAWHRPYGLLAILGPGIKKGEKVYGASLLDLTPTILTMLGCPVAEDMDGKPLTQVYEEPPTVERVPTYEHPHERPHDDTPVEETEDDPWVAQKMLEQMAALGYVDKDATAEGVVLDRARNLGQVYAATGKPENAIAQFEEVLDKKPDDAGTKMAIASCLLQLGRLDECETIAAEVLGAQDDAPKANLFLGMIAFRRDDPDKALEHLRAAEAENPDLADLQVQIGNVLLRREQWDQAEKAFDRAIEIDGDSADAFDGIGVAYRNQKRSPQAVLAHVRAIALLHYRPRSHINLGLALAEAGRVPWAIEAFNVAIEQNPQNPFPHRCLAELYERAMKDSAKAGEHRKRADELREAMSHG